MKPAELRVSDAAQRDIVDILEWSIREFGQDASLRYEALLTQALRDLGDEWPRAGLIARPELGRGVHVFHLASSRKRAVTEVGIVRRPRHFLVARAVGETVEILRVLHDARELSRHVPEI